jgi:hypothetical protein
MPKLGRELPRRVEMTSGSSRLSTVLGMCGPGRSKRRQRGSVSSPRLSRQPPRELQWTWRCRKSSLPPTSDAWRRWRKPPRLWRPEPPCGRWPRTWLEWRGAWIRRSRGPGKCRLRGGAASRTGSNQGMADLEQHKKKTGSLARLSGMLLEFSWLLPILLAVCIATTTPQLVSPTPTKTHNLRSIHPLNSPRP